MLLIRFVLICVCNQLLLVIVQVLAEGSYILINLFLQRFRFAMTALCKQLGLSRAPGSFTHKALGGSALVSGPAEPALRIKTSSEPAVTFETSAAAWSNFFGSEMSVTTMWMFLRFAASSSSGPAVPRLRMMANTWLFGSTDLGGAVSMHAFAVITIAATDSRDYRRSRAAKMLLLALEDVVVVLIWGSLRQCLALHQ